MGLKRAAFILLIISAALLYFYNKDKTYELTRTGFAMNTIIRITVYGDDKKILNDALDWAFEFLNTFEHQISLYDPNSQLSAVNNSAGIKPVKVSDDVINIISRTVEINKMTDGAFNPLIGAVTKLWRINDADHNKIPDPVSIDEAIKLTDINIINIDAENGTIYLDKAGAMLDLSGIAKGYASQKIADYFSGLVSPSGGDVAVRRQRGQNRRVTRALIDLGGNIQVVSVGNPLRGGEGFNIGIRDPLNKAAAPALVVKSNNDAVITSGNYERYKIIDGVKYSHFFDPKTGMPVKNNMLSATILADSQKKIPFRHFVPPPLKGRRELVPPLGGMSRSDRGVLFNNDGALADALATSFMIMGHERALEFIDKYNIKAVLMISDDTSSSKIKIIKNF